MKTILHSRSSVLASTFAFTLAAASLLLPGTLPAAAGIANVRASQRAGTDLVDIRYDLDTTNPGGLLVRVSVSTNGGLSYTLPATNFSGDVGLGITAGANKLIVWDAARDWPEKFSTNVFFRLTASDMVLIPAGSFTMGNCMSPSEGNSDELPLHTVYVSAFYMDRYEVTKALWVEVYQWAITHGYTFDYAGSGKASTHPVQTIDWYDCVKWCNARSEKEGRVPAYYNSAAQTTPYRTGQISVQNDWVNWNSGYRLPTEAEWEKAARGGASGHRFPWSDADTITWSRANYYAYPSGYTYDVNPTEGFHPTFATGGYPYTSPVGYFAPNGYGLYDMAGNVWEWCWDWYGSYSSGSQTDPRGPASGSYRSYRGGSWFNNAIYCRTAYRLSLTPADRDYLIGFRSVLPSGQ
jgi:formylglycine-generating enzyme required for sulfatase activity